MRLNELTALGEIIRLKKEYTKALEQGKELLRKNGYSGNIEMFKKRLKEVEHQRNKLYREEQRLRFKQPKEKQK